MPFGAFTDSTYNRAWPVSMRPGPATRCDDHLIGYNFTDTTYNRTWGRMAVPECMTTSTEYNPHPYVPGSYECGACYGETMPMYVYVTFSGVLGLYSGSPSCDDPRNECWENETNQSHTVPELAACSYRKDFRCDLTDIDCGVITWAVVLVIAASGITKKVTIVCGGQFNGNTGWVVRDSCLPWSGTVSNDGPEGGQAAFYIPGP